MAFRIFGFVIAVHDDDEFALFDAEGGVFEDRQFTALAIRVALGKVFNLKLSVIVIPIELNC